MSSWIYWCRESVGEDEADWDGKRDSKKQFELQLNQSRPSVVTRSLVEHDSVDYGSVDAIGACVELQETEIRRSKRDRLGDGGKNQSVGSQFLATKTALKQPGAALTTNVQVYWNTTNKLDNSIH